MILLFQLSMPGRRFGEDKLYAITKSFRSQKDRSKAREILSKGNYGYGWNDGWFARITVKEVSQPEARVIRSRSAGFCGYDWMVESILVRGCIKANHEIAAEVSV